MATLNRNHHHWNRHFHVWLFWRCYRYTIQYHLSHRCSASVCSPEIAAGWLLSVASTSTHKQKTNKILIITCKNSSSSILRRWRCDGAHICIHWKFEYESNFMHKCDRNEQIEWIDYTKTNETALKRGVHSWRCAEANVISSRSHIFVCASFFRNLYYYYHYIYNRTSRVIFLCLQLGSFAQLFWSKRALTINSSDLELTLYSRTSSNFGMAINITLLYVSSLWNELKRARKWM